ncbi:MAG: hypothetical protein EPN17_04015 [Methylobacter sp.]|nr:MAG: hypothetical protein EPN17_04015 [Methylobacter sp.]
MASKSNGVTITGNTCKTVDDIALGSEFKLMPGARLWFKSQQDTDTLKTQGICQSRSALPISISVNNSKLPWIKANDLSNCSSWIDNKMSCDDSAGAAKALTCVIATIDSESHPKGPEQRTTSVRMRTLSTTDDLDKTESAQDGMELDQEQIVSAMQPDINLCKSINHTAAPIKITWLVETNSRVNTVNSTPSNHTDQPFIDCITVVIKDFPYPQPSQAIWLSNQF